jgi:hypothetical protein
MYENWRRRCEHTVVACRYIHQKPVGGVHEYLCNRLFELTDGAVEAILSQLCELAVRAPQPSAFVQRALVGLSARSTRTALKVRCCRAAVPCSLMFVHR